ncbi:MAG: response regulator transcription factor [Chloroflexota bacterium]
MTLRRISALVVNNDILQLRTLRRILELEGYRVLAARNGEGALAVLKHENPDLVLLDVILPDRDGYTICRHMRQFSPVPILLISAKTDDQEMVKGLESGADDYIIKPFSVKELTARIKAVLRRTALWDDRLESTCHIRDLAVDFTSQRVTLANEEIDLTATEYRILSYLAQNAGRVLATDQIIDRIWGSRYCGDNHLLQVNIARLRKKIKDDSRNPKYISTRRGTGYIIRGRSEYYASHL